MFGRFDGSRRQCKEIENAHCDGSKWRCLSPFAYPIPEPFQSAAAHATSNPCHRQIHDARQDMRLHRRHSMRRNFIEQIVRIELLEHQPGLAPPRVMLGGLFGGEHLGRKDVASGLARHAARIRWLFHGRLDNRLCLLVGCVPLTLRDSWAGASLGQRHPTHLRPSPRSHQWLPG